jgi:hypothetical protein
VRNAAELVGQVQRAVQQGAAAPVIVVDGLDEARGQAFAMAEELLLRLAPYAVIIVATRELRRGETDPSLLDVLTAGGTPYRGAASALAQLVNGAHPGLGPFRLELTSFARSMPSLHQLLHGYACLQQGGDLAKTTGVTLPELDPAMVTDAMRFYTGLQDAEAQRPQSLTATHAIVGTTQPTATTARLAGGRIELLDSYQDQDLYGDSTVPIVAACRPDVPNPG